MSHRLQETDDRPTGQTTGGESGLDTQCNGVPENQVVAVKERTACDRCRQRKTKCNRVNPCSHCTNAKAHCTYRLAYKAKEKRQRVLISDVYERRLEQISNRIEEVYGIIAQGRNDRHTGGSGLVAPSRLRTPSYSSLPSARLWESPRASNSVEGIESAYLAHFFSAASAVEAAVLGDPHFGAMDGINLALNALRSTVNDQRQHSEKLQGTRPFLKSLPSGLSLRELPLPPLDKIMACLRVCQDCSPSDVYWPFEFGSLGDFTQYVIRACTPGPIGDMELIIVHYVLYSLFSQLSVGANDEALVQDYNMQAETCRESLETILSNLSFHIDTNTDSICALYMASLHSLHRGTVPTAWTFISRASLMCQDLGLHSREAMESGQTNEIQRNMSLFWAVYALEKAVALRLGRPSTIRDQDITILRPTMNSKITCLAFNRLPDWIDIASLYGRLYDNLYSPTALAQPNSVRVSRTSALASELEGIIAARTVYYNQPDLWSRHVLDITLPRFMIHANKAIEYSILASIYRGPPTEPPSEIPSGTRPSTQCLTAARASLKETQSMIGVLSNGSNWPTALHQWINGILLAAPFVPFTILATNAVTGSTAEAPDLHRLKGIVDGLQSLAQSPRYTSCNRQLRIFKTLLNVAARYVERKTSMIQTATDTGISSLVNNPHTDLYCIDEPWLEGEFPLGFCMPSSDMAPLGFLQDLGETPEQS
ncbi:Zn(II)2Cys6 transcription factor [Aspergillus stella-maris]|uniref:Zn(II)2Cys6 transcription factor n=1 Tax=Aspergillus stella-maris TaxID=1810926 RepID=UPI003CCD0C31